MNFNNSEMKQGLDNLISKLTPEIDNSFRKVFTNTVISIGIISSLGNSLQASDINNIGFSKQEIQKNILSISSSSFEVNVEMNNNTNININQKNGQTIVDISNKNPISNMICQLMQKKNI